jgi:threonine dehydratase
LEHVAARTPVLHSRQFDNAAGCSVYFKAENFQRAGAFKFRGAYNKIRAEMERQPVSAVVAYSSGNHAQAVSLVAKLLELRAIIVMPQDAPSSKVEATRGYGAQIVFYNRYSESREEIGKKIAQDTGALLVPPYDDYLIMAGQGTAAAELLEEVPDLDFLLTPASHQSNEGIAVGAAKLAAFAKREPPAARSCEAAKAQLERNVRPDHLEAANVGELALRFVVDRGAIALPRLHRHAYVIEALAAMLAPPLASTAALEALEL